MSAAAQRPCSHPGCGALTRDGRCEKHPRMPWVKAAPVKRTLVGRRLQRTRERKRLEDPLCVECRKLGLVEAWTILDHIVPIEEGGGDEWSNLQGLCELHSDAKTAREAQRGRQRADSH